jgi:hypothetical protein
VFSLLLSLDSTSLSECDKCKAYLKIRSSSSEKISPEGLLYFERGA